MSLTFCIKDKDGKFKKESRGLPSNFLCLETNVVLILRLLSSTKISNSCLLCWWSLSSISDVQQVYPWGQTRRCSPEGDRDRERHFYTHHCHRIRFSKGRAEALIKTLLWFWDSHQWGYQRGTERNKWGRIIFVSNLLPYETESNSDIAVHSPQRGFYLRHSPKLGNDSTGAHLLYQYYTHQPL